MVMRWFVAILVEKMSHAALPWLSGFNPLNSELNPICHLQALLGAHHIFHVSGLGVNGYEMICCDSGRKIESRRINMVTGF
jgi:hypothetical protein